MADVSEQRDSDTPRIEHVQGVLRRIAPDRALPVVEVTDETGSSARRASFGRPDLIAMSRATIDLGGAPLDGEVAHELAHLIDPHGARDWRLVAASFVLQPAGLAASLYNGIHHTLSRAAGSGLLLWAAGTVVSAAGLWWFVRINRAAEFRADRIAAELLGGAAPVVAMVERVHVRYVARSRTQRFISLMTHPHPARRRAALEAIG